MKNEQDIDKLFRRGLTDPVNETGFMEDDWDNLEQLLDGNKKRRGIVYWLPVISSVAAMALLLLGWWLFKPQETTIRQKPTQMAVVAHPKQIQRPDTAGRLTINIGTATKAGTGNLSKIPVIQPNTGITQTAAKAIKPAPNTVAIGKQDIYANNLINKRKASIKNKTNTGEITASTDVPASINSQPYIKGTEANELVAFNTDISMDANTASRQYINSAKPSAYEIENNGYAKSLAAKRNTIITTSSFKHPQLALTVMGAPEINGVSSFTSGKTGASAGLLFSVNMHKITISTGVGYAKKPYNTSFENYHSSGYVFKTYPINVIADCRAIDIPLNVDYQVFNKHQNKISVGTGVSSYLMMHESYNYDYADPSARGPRSYTIASPGKYLFGVLNLEATYQRQINSKVGISVQPYFKLPLTNISASQVKLQSAGVALGLSWNINSLTKP